MSHLALRSAEAWPTIKCNTSCNLLDVVQNKIHELIIALESTSHYKRRQSQSGVNCTCQEARMDGRQWRNRGRRTFSPAAKFDHNVLVHVFVQVKDILLLRSGLCLLRGSSTAATSASSTSSSSTTPAAAAELTSF